MELYEAKAILGTSLRCLAMSMEEIRKREIDMVRGQDEPMQDHLAECTWGVRPYESMDVDECLKYLRRLYKGLCQAAEHERKADYIVMTTKCDVSVIQIADMVFGMIGHDFPEDLLACATEINEVYKKLLPSGKKYNPTEFGCEKVVEKFLNQAEAIIKKYHLDTWRDGRISLPMGYLQAWMERKYWKH